MGKSKKILGRRDKYGIISILILITIPFLILNYFNHPAPENFYWAEETLKLGFSKVYRGFYKYVSGRYFTAALVSLNPLVLHSIALYKLYTLFLMIAFLYVTFLFVNEVTRNIFTSKERLLFSVSIIFLYLYGLASVREGFYWDIGAIHYHLSLVFIMFFYVFYIRLNNESKFTKRIFYLFICCLMAIIIPGTCELAAVLIFILIFSVILKNYFIDRKFNLPLLFLALLTVICTYVSFSAPGNFQRYEWFLEGRNLSVSVYNSLTYLMESMLNWIFNTPLLIITLLFIPVFFKAVKEKAANEIFSMNLISSLLICFTILIINTFMIIWGQGGLPYGRTTNFLYFVFLLGWFYNVILLISYINRKHKINVVKLPKYVYPAVVIIIVLFIFRENNIKSAYTDLFGGAASKYNNELNERYNFILNSTSDSVEVDAIKTIPKSFYSRDLMDDTSVWFEKAFAEYFNKKSIIIKK